MQFPKKLVSPTQVGNGLSCYGLSYIRGGHWHQEILAHAMEWNSVFLLGPFLFNWHALSRGVYFWFYWFL